MGALVYLTPQTRPPAIIPGLAVEVHTRLLLQATEEPPSGLVSVSFVASASGIVHEGAGSLDVTTGKATATLPSTWTEELDPGDSGGIVWTFSLTGGAVTVRQGITVVSQRTYPTVTTEELSNSYPSLVGGLRSSENQLREDLVEAWEYLSDDLFRFGVAVDQVFDPRSLARLHKLLAASIRYRKFAATNGDEAAQEESSRLVDEYRDLMSSGLIVDSDHTGSPDNMRQAPSQFFDIMRPYIPRSG